MTNTIFDENDPSRLEGKKSAIFVCWLLGLGSACAWNSILTVSDYYYKVFPDYHPSRVLTLVYQPCAIVTTAFLAHRESRIDTRKRNIFGFSLFPFSTLCCVMLDLATSGKGGVVPYIGLCIMVALFGVANSLVQGGMVGDLAFMLPEFNQSYFGGLAAAGALTSGLRLLTKAVFDNSHNGLRKGALLFWALSIVIECLCVFLYAFYFHKLPIVKYFRTKAASEGSKTVSADLAAAGIKQVESTKVDRLSLKQLCRQNWDYFLDLYLIYVLTLSIFPGFLYENTGKHGLGEWYALVLVAMYNVLDLIGSYTPLINWLRIESRKGLMISILARFVFIPAFYFTAKYAGQGWMIMLVALLGFTNAHLAVCVMTVAPRGYTGPEQNALGNLLVLFLQVGLFSGVCLDWLWIIGNEKF